MRRRNDSSTLLKWVIGITSSFIILCLIGYVLYLTGEGPLEQELIQNGYETDADNAFYNKVETANTLDDFYKDMKEEKDTSYVEYYVSKESNDFIELKMVYQDKINITVNVISDLSTTRINYNLELTYQDSHIMLDGNSDDDYSCNIIKQEHANQDTVNYYCNYLREEVTNFISKRNELLQNENISKRIK